MSYISIKKIVSTFLDDALNRKGKGGNAIEDDPTVLNIMQTYDRVSISDDVSSPMKDYAHRLVHNYLPAIERAYEACTATPNNKVSRLNKSVDDIRLEVLEQIDSCLIDIEYGAIYKDNLGDVFLNTMIVFEAQLEARPIEDNP